MEHSDSGEQHDQDGARDSGYAFAREHQREDHEKLFAERHVNARGLGYEHGGEREIEGSSRRD